MTDDQRRHPRIAFKKSVQTRSKNARKKGSLKDISASGAAISVDLDVKKDDMVQIDIEDMSPLSGRVARSFDDGIAVEFDLDEDEEERLLAEMMALHCGMRIGDVE